MERTKPTTDGSLTKAHCCHAAAMATMSRFLFLHLIRQRSTIFLHFLEAELAVIRAETDMSFYILILF